MRLYEELKRRRVFRVALFYILTCWIVLQLADIVFPEFPIPDWSMRLLLAVMVFLFPLVVLLAWIFQTSAGRITREPLRLSPFLLAGLGVFTLAFGVALGMLWLSVFADDNEIRTDNRPRVAVLPLKDMSPNGDKAYFSDGIHEELISRLAEIRSIAVPSRTTVDHYRNSDLTARDIALELGADYVVEGSVRHSSDRVLVTLQMIDGKTDAHVWVQDFDRELSVESLFDIQRSVAGKVASLLRTQLAPSELQLMAKAPTNSIDAYEAVLKGAYHYRRYNNEDLRLAIGHFRRATELDPDYAKAWSGLANSHMLAATTYGWMDPQIAIPLAKQYGARAIELDPYRGGAISLIGDIAYWYDYDPIAAEAKYQEGIAIDPHHVGNRLSYAYLLSTQRRFDEANAQIAYCLQEEPNAAHVLANAAWRHVDARQYEDVIQAADAAIAIAPDMQDARRSRAWALIYLGRLEEAARDSEIEQNVVINTLFLVRSGRIDEARAQVERVSNQMQNDIDRAMLYAAIEETDEAFRWIDKTIAARHRGALLIATWEVFDPLRSDPRYEAALKRIGLTGDTS